MHMTIADNILFESLYIKANLHNTIIVYDSYSGVWNQVIRQDDVFQLQF
jgi:hypothetical protein